MVLWQQSRPVPRLATCRIHAPRGRQRRAPTMHERCKYKYKIQIQLQIHAPRAPSKPGTNCCDHNPRKMQEQIQIQILTPIESQCVPSKRDANGNGCNLNDITFSSMPSNWTNFCSVAKSNGGNFFEYISRMYATMNAGVSSVLQELEMFALGSIE